MCPFQTGSFDEVSCVYVSFKNVYSLIARIFLSPNDVPYTVISNIPVCHSLFVHSPVEGQLRFRTSYFWAIMSNADISIRV